MAEAEKVCPTCGSTDIMEGDLSSTGGFVFIPESERGKFLMKSSYMTASACRSCGAVFGLRLTDTPNKLTNK
jgi:RNA polymerase subunit RPABC4/transcription elongation factor Spt4